MSQFSIKLLLFLLLFFVIIAPQLEPEKEQKEYSLRDVKPCLTTFLHVRGGAI